MTENPVKVGMLGAGFILKPHALAVSTIDGASLHAVADTSARRASDAAREFGFKHGFASVEELVRSDCDVVHVLVPPFLHVEVAERLLRAGKSVFLEKPMGLSSEACRKLGALADECGLRLGVNHNFLFLPSYERLRDRIRRGELGRIDHINCNWNYELPQLRSGPFDSWMLSSPANLFFELGPHLAGFLLDLLGEAEISAAVVGNQVELPSGERAYRSWSVIGHQEAAAFALSLSTTRGQPDRLLRIRGSGGSAQLDFGRDFAWEERTEAANPIFDAHAVAKSISRQVGKAAGADRRRRIFAALAKSLGSEPFSDSMLRSIARFYATPQIDERHHWSFGAKVMKFCEDVCTAAGVGEPGAAPIAVRDRVKKPSVPPTVLVVGGTGFIGRRLVAKLIEEGVGVRVLSRSRSAAALAFKNMPVDVHEGFHGNRDVAKAALSGVSTVYHLAKCEGKRWDDYVRGDVEPTRILAEEALAAGVTRFIYTGTIDSYDSASPSRRITGDTPLDKRMGGRNLYARSKAACEALLRKFSRDKGLPLVVLRPGIVIGAGTDPAHLGVAQFASETEVRYWGNGENKLPLVLVDDVADALARAKDAPGVIGRTLLLTGDPLLNAREYVAEVSARSGVAVRASARAPWRYWLADLAKEVAKNLVRHPNRRWPTLHDWRCRTHRAAYDSTTTRELLGWHPVADRESLVERGIQDAVDAAIR